MRVATIIQARAGSSRLPGKVLADVAGKTMLARVIARASRASRTDATIVATTDAPEDDPVAQEAARLGAAVWRGSVDDVLDRYYQAACAHDTDVVVRVTADCPLIDPGLIDAAVEALDREGADYAYHDMEADILGCNAEAFTTAALERAWREAKEPHERVHVTLHIYAHPENFRVINLPWGDRRRGYRWTVDTADDLEFVRTVYAHFGDKNFSWQDVCRFLETRPDVAALNRHVQAKELEEG
jgi:spore coat polysaccharide biosynthesis protein SpsF